MKRILAAFFTISTILAQSQTDVKISVRSSDGNEPISYARVRNLTTGQVQLTDALGVLTWKDLQVPYELVVSSLGFQSDTLSGNETTVTVTLSPSITSLPSVEVLALRANDETPMAFVDLEKEEIEKRNNGQDIPVMLDQLPSVVTTSDAGAGIGYTGLRIRGSDQARINVTVNGIPMNDAESHGVFWVNTPDLASSLTSMQVQRGVGTSTNGSGAFGASINMQTTALTEEAYGSIHLGAGSFNTQRSTLAFGSGLISDHWVMEGRVSRIKSDGWIDRATSDLSSYYLSLGYVDQKNTLKLIAFGGGEKTYQAWYGTDSSTYAMDPRFNYAGALYDTNWNVVDYYDNQTDNYKQDHYQLHWNHKVNEALDLNVSGHYTYGRGYYEEYQQGQYLPDFLIDPVVVGGTTIEYSDLVRRLWLDNDFYGAIANLTYSFDGGQWTTGGGYHRYEGDHFGQVIWARFASNSEIRHRFYDNTSTKDDWNIYSKLQFGFTKTLIGYVDLQVRGVRYKGSGLEEGNTPFSFSDDLFFFNPKAGVTWKISAEQEAFGSVAISNREPNRKDYLNAALSGDDSPKPENLTDLELGYRIQGKDWSLQANGFLMYYNNQLVLTGELDDVGYPLRENVGKSYRSGVEASAVWEPVNFFRWSANLTFSQNINLDYTWETSPGVFQSENTYIPYSPDWIAGNNLTFRPIDGLEVSLLSKFVGEQFMENTNQRSFMLPSYLVHDLRMSYRFATGWLQKARVYLHVNNLLSEEYASNGYVYGSTLYFYPQAPINLLGGIQLDL
ncbi:MAG: TonB-dependent receptor [Bacteroidota bacterium]|nr:TonB-dependent receptor [Bacteroidota bacterium]MDX5505960.1 TonB-dependent receptor [Bacteroidota bacterium]